MNKAMANKQERTYDEYAIQAIMNSRAMNEDKIDVDKLVGRKDRHGRKVDVKKEDNEEETKERRKVTKEEKKSELSSLEGTLGRAVKK